MPRAAAPSDGDQPTGQVAAPGFAATFGLGLTLRSAHLRAAAAYESALTPLGLELKHFAVLIELTQDGPLSQSELARRTGNDKVAIMRIVDHLESAALVSRRPRPGDRRVRVVTLTSDGQRVYRQAHLAARDVSARLLEHLAPADRAVFTALLDQFAAPPDPLQSAGPDVAPRP
ncbi:MAG TPA: MarR family winged helix-turn-helix transcriptional regulator [Pseudonocardia sp.]|jgi:DNA-binding MarR family transcriptional regulator|nr:MarR family winged helix-turn-helix transcriptional regulator [Pseudonocardia sp.]